MMTLIALLILGMFVVPVLAVVLILIGDVILTIIEVVEVCAGLASCIGKQ